MRPTTDYVRHAAKLARKLHTEAGLGGGNPQPNAEFYRILAKAMDEIAEGLERVGVQD